MTSFPLSKYIQILTPENLGIGYIWQKKLHVSKHPGLRGYPRLSNHTGRTVGEPQSEEAGQHDATAAEGQDPQLLDVELLIFL